MRREWRLAVWPILALVVFLINSRITVGAWFVSDGFYVPDPSYAGQPLRTLVGIWWGTHQLSGYAIETIALMAAITIAWRAVTSKEDSARLVTLALFAAAALPIVAFYQGHPYRIRYMIPEVAACAVFAGLAVGMIWRVRKDPPYRTALPASLAPVAREPKPRHLEWRTHLVRQDLFVREVSSQLAIHVLRVARGPLVIGAWLEQRRPHPFRRLAQVLHQRLQVRPDVARRPEMREEHRVRIPRFDAPRALRPQLDVDVRRRRRRAHVIALDADACGVADKRDAARAIEEADVM